MIHESLKNVCVVMSCKACFILEVSFRNPTLILNAENDIRNNKATFFRVLVILKFSQISGEYICEKLVSRFCQNHFDDEPFTTLFIIYNYSPENMLFYAKKILSQNYVQSF